MHELYELKEKLMQELEAYGKKELSAGSLEVVDKLAHSIKNICKIIEAADEENGYSQRGDYSRNGGGRYSYNNDGGYSRDGNSYARGRGRNASRDSMGRYSRTGNYYSSSNGVEEMLETIQGMMQELPQEIQQDAQRFVSKLEQHM